MAVLLLNADYTPIRILSWERAICLLLSAKVDLLVARTDRLVRSPSCTLPWPSIVTLKRYTKLRHGAKLSRRNILARDGFRCQYCGVAPVTASGRPRLDQLSIDHVVPRAQSSNGQVRLPWGNTPMVPVTCWENVVAACCDCNTRKGSRTPAQSGLTLARLPRRPSPMDTVRIVFAGKPIPAEWEPYLPTGWTGTQSNVAA